MLTQSKTNIKFTYNHEGYYGDFGSLPTTDVVYTIDGDCNITEACHAFENFLLACGFRLNEGESVGIIEAEIDKNHCSDKSCCSDLY